MRRAGKLCRHAAVRQLICVCLFAMFRNALRHYEYVPDPQLAADVAAAAASSAAMMRGSTRRLGGVGGAPLALQASRGLRLL